MCIFFIDHIPIAWYFFQVTFSKTRIRSMRTTILLFIILFGNTAFGGWDDIVATPIEQVTAVGVPVDVKIRFERDLGLGMFNPNVSGLPVKFYLGLNGELLNSVLTNSDGIAKVKFFATQPGRFVIVGEIEDGESSHSPIKVPVYVLEPTDRVIVSDIDGTLSDLPDYLIPVKSADAPTFPDAPEVLNWISQCAHVIYLTNRDQFLYSATKQFLANREFPIGPLLMNRYTKWGDFPFEKDPMRAALFKRDLLLSLKDRGIEVELGLGDRNSDAWAYNNSGVESFIRESDKSDLKLPSTIYSSYRDLKGKLEERWGNCN